MKIEMKSALLTAAAVLLYAPARAVEPWIDPETGRPEIPPMERARGIIKPLPPVPVDMEVRADPDGFPSVTERARGIRVTGSPETGSRFKMWGKAGMADVDFTFKKYRRNAADEVIEGFLLSAPGTELRLEAVSLRDPQYVIFGRAAGVDGQVHELRLYLDPIFSPEYEIRSPSVNLRMQSPSAVRIKLTGRYDPKLFDDLRLAMLGAYVAVLRLDPPQRRDAAARGWLGAE